MFGLGFWETIVIILVAVVVIKPEKLPAFMRKAGQLFGKAQAAYDTLRRALYHFDHQTETPKPAGAEPPVPNPYREVKPVPKPRRRRTVRGRKKPSESKRKSKK